jgi:hypothetical protein
VATHHQVTHSGIKSALSLSCIKISKDCRLGAASGVLNVPPFRIGVPSVSTHSAFEVDKTATFGFIKAVYSAGL